MYLGESKNGKGVSTAEENTVDAPVGITQPLFDRPDVFRGRLGSAEIFEDRKDNSALVNGNGNGNGTGGEKK